MSILPNHHLFQSQPANLLPVPVCHLRFFHRPGSPRHGRPDSDTKEEQQPQTVDAVICRQCLHEITAADQRKTVEGAHTHTFANPQGIVFEIACYQDAWGCGYIGPASDEFTWFAGFVWRIAVCGNCHVHIGWRFSAPDGHNFHGLIASRIQSSQTP